MPITLDAYFALTSSVSSGTSTQEPVVCSIPMICALITISSSFFAPTRYVATQSSSRSTPSYNRFKSVPYIGHTEIFGALTGTEDPLTMFEVHGMRIFFLSRHVSLRKACDMVTKERIKDYVKHSLEVLKKLGVKDGTMAIAGLNPHCGEHGIL